MKLNLIDWLYIIASSVTFLAIFIKFILWISINNKRRIGFLKTFIIWFSVHDVHNASSRQSHRFRSYNNIINIIFWIGIILVVATYVFDTNTIMDTPPPRIPQKK